MNTPTVVLLGNHTAGHNDSMHHIEQATSGYCSLMVGLHRYGSGWAAAIVPPHKADTFDDLMSASGSDPFVFSYAVEGDPIPQLPFVFANCAAEAIAKLEARLATGKTHDPESSLTALYEAVQEAAIQGCHLHWIADYYSRYAEWHGITYEEAGGTPLQMERFKKALLA